MKKILLVLLVAFISMITFAQNGSQVIAGSYFNAFFTGNYEQAFEMQADTVKAQFGIEQMKAAAASYDANYGKIMGVLSVEENQQGAYYIATYYTQFEKGYLNVNIVLDADKKVAQFLAQPAAAPDSVASYVNKGAFQEVDITVGDDTWKLPGKLTVPAGKESFPIMVLIGGSGPTDMDGTMGPNKTYRDIAWGLATNGIATIRYSKRPAIYGKDMGQTETEFIKYEYVDDALAAINLAASIPGVSNIYFAGHSLGGTVSPNIAKMDDRVNGLIMLAGGARRFAQISIDQNKYIAPIYGITEEQLQQTIAFFQSILNKELPASTEIQPGLPVAYYYDLDNYISLEKLEGYEKPVLVIQGEEDFQATMEGDFLPLKEKFGNQENFSFVSFPAMNHLFMKTEVGVFHTTEEYMVPDFVDEAVITTLSDWILSQE